MSFLQKIAVSVSCFLFFVPAVFAQLSMTIVLSDGLSVPISGKNIARADNSLVLYNHDYGSSTQTNMYGVEVIAVPVAGQTSDGLLYEVSNQTSVWKCLQNRSLNCGNAIIPTKGIVLSATGDKRKFLLDKLAPGTRFVLQNNWFQQIHKTATVIDPTPVSNPVGSGFPGFRASHQLIAYTSSYPHPTTQTNEFGFEVTVQNGVVTAQEGSDSTIPEDGFVLSGHGHAREWLIRHAVLGSKVSLDPLTKEVSIGIDFGTYAYQFDRQWNNSLCKTASVKMPGIQSSCSAIHNKRQEAALLFQRNQPEQAAETMQNALGLMSKTLWGSYQLFPSSAIKGAWHRPVEHSSVDIGKTLDRLKQAGINTVFLETFFHGYTIFPSKTYQTYGLPIQNPKFVGLDLLKAWVEQAHQRNMKIHTWFQTFYVGTTAFHPPGPILSSYPSWANVQFSALKPDLRVGVKNRLNTVISPSEEMTPLLSKPDKPTPSTLELGGYFLDPSNPMVQTFLMALIKEITTQYDIDGFQFDYIRYPASFPANRFSYRKTTWGYTDVARQAFLQKYGLDPATLDPKNPDFQTLWASWNDYKTEQVNHFVEMASKQIRASKPKIIISAAVFPKLAVSKALKHQDWALWANSGWVDCFTPMTLTSALKVVNQDTREVISMVSSEFPVYSGLFGPFNNNSADQILDQIKTAKEAGASGYVLFDTAHLTNATLSALKIAQTESLLALPDTVADDSSPEKPAVLTSDVLNQHKKNKKTKKGWWIFKF